MTFIIVSLVSAAILFLGLTFHRFCTAHPEARKSTASSVTSGEYGRWVAARTSEFAQSMSPARWRDITKNLSFLKYPDLEKWLFLSFYVSFLYLAASGFFFALFIPRGLYGYPLLGHVVAGGIFAVSLSLIVLLRGRNYIHESRFPESTPLTLDLKRLRLTAESAQDAAFWIFVLAGLTLTATALIPMFPFLRYGGLKLMFELHRYGALVAVLSAVAFVDLERFNSKRPKP